MSNSNDATVPVDDMDGPFELPKRRTSFLPHLPHFYKDTRDRRVYKQVSNRPRWVLHMQAVMWRFLMGIGMLLHRLARPRPPKPNFHRTIETTIAGKPGHITLYFYTPPDYSLQKRLWHAHPDAQINEHGEVEDQGEGTPIERNKTRMSISSLGGDIRRIGRSAQRWGGYPVVINYHGGGFTLGSAYDDARWCGTVVTECDAVVVSVDYRLAPEHPFPTAVEDGVDAVIWVHEHAVELGVDTNKIMLSGFSSGANMAFTVPLRLYDQQTDFHREEPDLPIQQRSVDAGNVRQVSTDGQPGSSSSDLTSKDSTKVPQNDGNDGQSPPPPGPGKPNKANATFVEKSITSPDIRIRGIVPWYPSLDYTRTREERRATCVRADHELPALFTNLFDDSYLHPPKDVSLDSPYLSPGVAPTSLLRNALPDDIILHTCEFDMLLDEGRDFYERLISDDIGKNVVYTMIPGVPHGWDKAPNPLKPTPGVKEYYLKACKEMRRILCEQRPDTNNRLAQPRMSVVN